MENKKDFDYTIVLDGNYADNSGHEEMSGTMIERLRREPDDAQEAMDRLYYDYERMCLKDPTILDKDDMYPHTYHWRMGDKYDPAKKAVLEEAIKLKVRVADTEAYQKYVEEISHRSFAPDSWD